MFHRYVNVYQRVVNMDVFESQPKPEEPISNDLPDYCDSPIYKSGLYL